MSPPTQQTEEVDKLANLVITDYEQTLKVVDGFVRVSTSVRTLATTVWVGLLAVSIQAEQFELSLVAAGAIPIFALLDAYHGWLYSQASERAYEIEKLLEQYYKYIPRADQQEELKAIRKALRQHRFGQLSHMSKLSKKFYFEARPTFFYRFLYPAFLVAAILAALAVGASEEPAEASRSWKGCDHSMTPHHPRGLSCRHGERSRP